MLGEDFPGFKDNDPMDIIRGEMGGDKYKQVQQQINLENDEKDKIFTEDDLNLEN